MHPGSLTSPLIAPAAADDLLTRATALLGDVSDRFYGGLLAGCS